MKYSAVILAAGSGSRTGLNFNKVFYEIKGKRIVEYSLDFFLNEPLCNQIILVVNETNFSSIQKQYSSDKILVILGGNTRQQSVYKSLTVVVNKIVLIHDSARPFINSSSVTNLLTVLETNMSATLGVKVKDTISVCDGNRLVKSLRRDSLVALQTPQGFNLDLLLESHELAIKEGFTATDDTALLKKYKGIDPIFVIGDYRSIKLTTIDDIKLLEVIL